MWSPLAERYIAIGEARGFERGFELGFELGFERGFKIGFKIGELEGRIEAVISILDVKFGEVSETVRDSLCVITDVNRLQALIRFAAKCDTFEEFYKQLNIDKT